MPELGWTYGYPFALGLMTAVAVVMLYHFWRRGWITDGTKARTRDDRKGDGAA